MYQVPTIPGSSVNLSESRSSDSSSSPLLETLVEVEELLLLFTSRSELLVRPFVPVPRFMLLLWRWLLWLWWLCWWWWWWWPLLLPLLSAAAAPVAVAGRRSGKLQPWVWQLKEQSQENCVRVIKVLKQSNKFQASCFYLSQGCETGISWAGPGSDDTQIKKQIES